MDMMNLREEEKKKSVPSLMFLTKKRCGTEKAQECTNGPKKRKYIKKEDATSPMVCLYLIFITRVIEEMENRDVAIIDIAGAFLHAGLEGGDQVLMVMEGRLAEFMAITEPKIYRKYISTHQKGKKVHCVNLQKHCVGC